MSQPIDPKLIEAMKAEGFHLVETGGGCTAFQRRNADMTVLHISHEAAAPTTLDTPCYLCLYEMGGPARVDAETLCHQECETVDQALNLVRMMTRMPADHALALGVDPKTLPMVRIEPSWAVAAVKAIRAVLYPPGAGEDHQWSGADDLQAIDLILNQAEDPELQPIWPVDTVALDAIARALIEHHGGSMADFYDRVYEVAQKAGRDVDGTGRSSTAKAMTAGDGEDALDGTITYLRCAGESSATLLADYLDELFGPTSVWTRSKCEAVVEELGLVRGWAESAIEVFVSGGKA
jgi:hypothetical protein